MNRSWGADPPAARHTYACRSQPLVAVPPLPAEPETEFIAVPVTNPQHFRLADELAPMVEVWQRLLSLHRPDRTGRCRTCTQGGTGLPGTQWPCALHGIAELAQRRHGHAQGA